MKYSMKGGKEDFHEFISEQKKVFISFKNRSFKSFLGLFLFN